MESQFEPGSSLKLSLPDGAIDITSQTTQEERQKILDDLRSRYPDMLRQAPELESMIMGTYRPPAEMTFEDISSPEGQRKAVEDMRRAHPEEMRQDPRIEQALTGDKQALDELIAEGVSITGSVSIVKGDQLAPSPAADTDSPPPVVTTDLTGPVNERKGFLSRLFGRG